MYAKSIFIVTTSIFGSVFLGIFLSTIIFDGPSPDSGEFFENESLEKSTIPKTPIESTVEEEPELELIPIESTVEEEPELIPIESTVEEEPEPTPIESTVEEESELELIPIELEGTVTTSSSTGVQ